jgi:hypothetical protein
LTDFRRFFSVKLENIERGSLENTLNTGYRFINEKPNDCDERWHRGHNLQRLIYSNHPGTSGVEIQTYCIGA